MITLTTNSTIASICIQDLSAYNQGFLVYEWVNLPISQYELQTVINRVLEQGAKLCKDDLHEEIMLGDYESDYLDINEYSNPFLLNTMAEELENLETYELKKYSYLIKQVGYNHDQALNNLDDCDIYENMNMIELAEQFIDEGLFGAIPDNIINYIDYERVARDLSMDYTEYNGDIYRVY